MCGVAACTSRSERKETSDKKQTTASNLKLPVSFFKLRPEGSLPRNQRLWTPLSRSSQFFIFFLP